MENKSRRRLYKVTFIKGFLDMLPLNLAVIPWGVLCGSLAIQRDFSILEALLMPLIVFAGSAQLVTTELIGGNVALATILFTTFIISSRHFLYGLSLREKMKGLPLRWRLSLGFLLTDELFALSGHKKSFNGKVRLLYALFSGGSFYISWFLWNVIGIFAGSYLPDLTHLGLDFAIAVTFIALVIPSIKNFPILCAVISSGVSAVFLKVNNVELDLVISAFVGMSVGYFLSHSAWYKKASKRNERKEIAS